jgi:serine/threonine-protein kinase
LDGRHRQHLVEVSLPAPVRPGDVVAGKYRVERLLGEGGMGVVIEATHIALNERVAMKFLKAGLALQSEPVQRFLREARAAVRIKSPHVARVSDFGALESGVPFIVMEFLHGQDALALVAGQGRLSAEQAIDIVIQACDALAEAHSLGIVHRDIKPANLFVSRHADGSTFVKVLDFGISKLSEGDDASLTRTTAALGSAAYMSPEQMRQSRSVDQRTDVYSLGVTLFELLTATRPFDGESYAALCVEVATATPKRLDALRPDLPPELARVLDRVIARDPAHRYQNVGELALALAPWGPESVRPLVQRIARLTGASPAKSPALVTAAAPARSPAVATAAATHVPSPAISTTSQFAHSAATHSSSNVGIVVIAAGVIATLLVVIVAAVIVVGRTSTPSTAAEPSIATEPSPPAATSLAAPPPSATVSVLPPVPAPSSSPAPEQPRQKVTAKSVAKPAAKTSGTQTATPPSPTSAPKKPEVDLNER